jgi:hypothetical protein
MPNSSFDLVISLPFVEEKMQKEKKSRILGLDICTRLRGKGANLCHREAGVAPT